MFKSFLKKKIGDWKKSTGNTITTPSLSILNMHRMIYTAYDKFFFFQNFHSSQCSDSHDTRVACTLPLVVQKRITAWVIACIKPFSTFVLYCYSSLTMSCALLLYFSASVIFGGRSAVDISVNQTTSWLLFEEIWWSTTKTRKEIVFLWSSYHWWAKNNCRVHVRTHTAFIKQQHKWMLLIVREDYSVTKTPQSCPLGKLGSTKRDARVDRLPSRRRRASSRGSWAVTQEARARVSEVRRHGSQSGYCATLHAHILEEPQFWTSTGT